MDSESVKILEEEFGRHLQARMKLGDVNIMDIMGVAKFCLVVNLLILEKRLGSYLNYYKEYIEEFSNLLTNLLGERYSEDLENLLEIFRVETELLLRDANVKTHVNQHYNMLYGAEGGDVI